MSALHLNLLNPMERRSASPVRAKFILPVVAGLVMLFVLVWGGFVGIQLVIATSKVDSIRSAIVREANRTAETEALKAKSANLQAEIDQYAFYLNGREKRGELLKRLAFAIPDGITLTSLAIPPSPEQGATQAVERIELRLIGLAGREQDVFKLMQALEGNAFTGLVSIVKHPDVGQLESPRVLAFRQEAPTDGHRNVFFDIIYDLKPREFVK